MRPADHTDRRLLVRVLDLLRSVPGPVPFPDLCRGLGCDDREDAPEGADNRVRAIMNAPARRERQLLQRVLQQAEADGVIERWDDVVGLNVDD
jgi:hypothetical protein